MNLFFAPGKVIKPSLNHWCSYSASVGATHFQTSAKTNRGIEEMFLEISRQLLVEVRRESAANVQNTSQNQGIVIVEDDPVMKKTCCNF